SGDGDEGSRGEHLHRGHRFAVAVAEKAAEEGLAFRLIQLEGSRDRACAYFELRQACSVVGKSLVEGAKVGTMAEQIASHLRLQMFESHEGARVEAELVCHALAPARRDVREERLECTRDLDDLLARTLLQRQYCGHD